MSTNIRFRVRSMAVDLLSRQMYSVSDLRNKLQKRFSDEDSRELIEEVLDDFCNQNILNDQEYANTFVRYQISQKPRSMQYIRQKLVQKGISTDTIDEAFSSQEYNEEEMARQSMEAKTKTLSVLLPDQKKKEKLIRFLQGQGFGLGIIFSVLERE